MEQGDIDRHVERAVDGITAIARRAAAFSTRLLLGTLIVCVGGFLLGVAALSDGIETVWIVLGIAFGAMAIGSAIVARWRVGAVRRHAPDLAAEMRGLMSRDDQAGRTVVEVFTVDDPEAMAGMPSQRPGERGSAMIMSRRMYGFRELPHRALTNAPRLSGAIRAVTTFPLLVLGAVLVSLVFAFLGVVFLLALAL